MGQHLGGREVVEALPRIGLNRRLPKTIRVDNGTEFTSKVLDQWAYANQVTFDFSRPGKPTDNAVIESFNGRVRAECLNENWFPSLDDARTKAEAWRHDYNNHRPHSSPRCPDGGQPGSPRIRSVLPGNSGQITILDFRARDGSENGSRSAVWNQLVEGGVSCLAGNRK